MHSLPSLTRRPRDQDEAADAAKLNQFLLCRNSRSISGCDL